nr:FAD-dependent oxidoreductase [Hoeflea sp. 108]
MSGQRVCDILIVGAGATGSLAALVLAQAGLDVVCLEQGSWLNAADRPHRLADWSWQRRTGWTLTSTSANMPMIIRSIPTRHRS